MQIKSIAECLEHSAILSTFIKLPFVIKIFVYFWVTVYTGFTEKGLRSLIYYAFSRDNVDITP